MGGRQDDPQAMASEYAGRAACERTKPKNRTTAGFRLYRSGIELAYTFFHSQVKLFPR